MAATLDTYAHWKGITRQALEDIPQIRSIVENRLRQGVTVALETAVGAALVAATLPAVTSPVDLLAAIRAGVGAVQVAGYWNPNAVLLNPADFAAPRHRRDAGDEPRAADRRVLGDASVAVPSLAVGTAYVGDFNAGVQLFDGAPRPCS